MSRTALLALGSSIAIAVGCGSSEPDSAKAPRQDPAPLVADGVTPRGTAYEISSYRQDGLLCTELRTVASGGAGGCGPAPSAESPTALQAGSVGGETIVFGVVRPDVARVEVTSVETGGSVRARPTAARLVHVPLPTGWTAPGPPGSEEEPGPPPLLPVLDVVAYGADGEVLRRRRVEPPVS